MKRLSFPDLTLMALTASSLIMSGAQLFAVSIIASTVSKTPPRSFAIFSGEYAYDSRAFWDVVPTIVSALFLVALIANWKTPRRYYLVSALGLFVLSGFIAFLYLEPTFDAIIAQGFSDHVDTVMQRNASTWYMIDWASWCILFAASLTLLFALVQPQRSDD